MVTQRWVTLARVGFWAALAFALFMALSPHPPHVPGGALPDKVQHSAAFVVMTILAVAAYPRAELLRVAERLSFLGALIEVMQSIPRLHRDCDILDWVADTAAIAAVMLVVILWRARRPGAR